MIAYFSEIEIEARETIWLACGVSIVGKLFIFSSLYFSTTQHRYEK